MTTDTPLSPHKAAALRDFFAAVDAKDLKSAAADIERHFSLPMSTDTDWVEVEYDFNRMFVGPAAVPAPPYASAYQTEPSLMGRPALEARRVYLALGLEVPQKNTTPDDHLAYELDAVAALAGATDDDETRNELSRFVGEHMHGWIPRFVDAVREQADVSEPIRQAVSALAAWLDSARNEIQCTQS